MIRHFSTSTSATPTPGSWNNHFHWSISRVFLSPSSISLSRSIRMVHLCLTISICLFNNLARNVPSSPILIHKNDSVAESYHPFFLIVSQHWLLGVPFRSTHLWRYLMFVQQILWSSRANCTGVGNYCWHLRWDSKSKSLRSLRGSRIDFVSGRLEYITGGHVSAKYGDPARIDAASLVRISLWDDWQVPCILWGEQKTIGVIPFLQ